MNSHTKKPGQHRHTQHQAKHSHCLRTDPHHAHYCPQFQCEPIQVNLNCQTVNSTNHQMRPQSNFHAHFPNSSTNDSCLHSTESNAGCCSGSTSGAGGCGSSHKVEGANVPPNKSAGSYQQRKHRRAYVVDEISR